MSDLIHIGNRGEAICQVLMTKFCFGKRFPFFSLHFLGDRHETVDYLIRLVEDERVTPLFFFVQVKTTNRGYNKDGHLRIQVSKSEVARLKAYPAPTYLIGIDLADEVGCIVSAHESLPESIASIPTKYALNCENLERLWNEVKDFWEARDMRLRNSGFVAYKEDNS